MFRADELILVLNDFSNIKFYMSCSVLSILISY